MQGKNTIIVPEIRNISDENILEKFELIFLTGNYLRDPTEAFKILRSFDRVDREELLNGRQIL